jgi:hypothetical protein
LKIVYKHQRTKAEALKIIEETIPTLLASYGSHLQDVHHEWDGDTVRFSAKAMSMTLEGTGTVTDTELIFEMKLPFLARAFEEPARRRIITHLDGLLA